MYHVNFGNVYFVFIKEHLGRLVTPEFVMSYMINIKCLIAYRQNFKYATDKCKKFKINWQKFEPIINIKHLI